MLVRPRKKKKSLVLPHGLLDFCAARHRETRATTETQRSTEVAQRAAKNERTNGYHKA